MRRYNCVSVCPPHLVNHGGWQRSSSVEQRLFIHVLGSIQCGHVLPLATVAVPQNDVLSYTHASPNLTRFSIHSKNYVRTHMNARFQGDKTGIMDNQTEDRTPDLNSEGKSAAYLDTGHANDGE